MNFSKNIKRFIEEKSEFYSSKNGIFKNIFLLIIELLNFDIIYIVNLFLLLFLKILNLIFTFIFVLLKKLIKRSFLFKVLKKKFLNLAYKQREILLLYYGKNDVYPYIVGIKKAAFTDPEGISNNRKVVYTLAYIIDNFLNTTEQYIERFVLIFRQIFIKIVFSIPNRIYYRIFPRNFSFKAVLKPKRFKLYVFRMLIIYYVDIITYGIDLLYFYIIVFFKNLALSLYEARKNIFIILILFLILNLIFKKSFFVIYDFFLNFFDFDFIIENIIRDVSFKRSMRDMFCKGSKYNYFFKSEYKQFYGSSELYKLYYIYLTIKAEFISNLENYGKFFKAFPPGIVFAFHYYYFFKKKTDRYRTKRKRKKRYGYRRKDHFVKNKKEKRFRKKAVFERDSQKRSDRVLVRIGKNYFGYFDDKIEGVYLYIGDAILFFIRDRTYYFDTKRTFYYKKKYSSTIIFKFLFGFLFRIFGLFKKLTLFAMKNTFFILVIIAFLFCIIIYLGIERKSNVKIVIKEYVFFDCTLEEFICNLILNSIIVFIFYYVISFIPAILYFYIFKVYKPFLIYLYKLIKKFLDI